MNIKFFLNLYYNKLHKIKRMLKLSGNLYAYLMALVMVSLYLVVRVALVYWAYNEVNPELRSGSQLKPVDALALIVLVGSLLSLGMWFA